MDLAPRLANLTLAEIASMLNTKQQEVLLAAISVAAKFIQQIQAAEEMQLQHHIAQAHSNNTQINQNSHSTHSQQHTPTTDHDTDQDFKDEDEDDDFNDDDNDSEFHDQSNAHDQTSDISFDNYSTSSCPGETLLTIREFAEELKNRRKLIRLSQKGAAQSLRAFTGGEQPCTDAIIYHFENLQLEPDRAMQLIPLLKEWLEWAEKHRNNGKQLPMMSAVTKVPRERKRKVVLFNEKAKQHLEDAFVKNNHPDRYQLEVISKDLNIPTRSIRKWFTNRRQRKRFAEKFLTVN